MCILFFTFRAINISKYLWMQTTFQNISKIKSGVINQGKTEQVKVVVLNKIYGSECPKSMMKYEKHKKAALAVSSIFIIE